MEINTQQIEALMRAQEQQAQRKSSEIGQSFDKVLSRQLSGENATEAAQTPGSAQAEMISQILLDKSGRNNDFAAMNAALDQASGALDLWESYAQTLGAANGQKGLKDAYAILEGIDSTVAQLREDTTALRGRNTGLDDVLNQLEILATTEKFKFNRGDYNIG